MLKNPATLIAGKTEEAGTIIQEYSLYYLCLLLPFQHVGIPAGAGVVGLIIGWVLTLNFKEKFRLLSENPFFVFSALFFLLHVAGIIYSENKDFAYSDVLLKSSMLIIPVVILSTLMNNTLLLRVLSLFVSGVSLAAFFCFSNACYLYFMKGENAFFYDAYSLFMHVAYFSVYIVFAISILVFHFLGKTNGINRSLIVILILFLTLNQILLASRTQQFLFFVLILPCIVLFMMNTKPFIYKVSSLIFLLFITGISFSAIPGANDRMKLMLSEFGILSDKVDINHSAIRLDSWKIGLNMIQDNFLFGTGTGDVKDDFHRQASLAELDVVVKNNYNFHNQYIQTFVALGLLGFLSLLAMLISLVYNSINTGNLLLMALVVSLIISMITESFLERQAGVIFFALMASLLFNRNQLMKLEGA